eukprot:364228-Chlamydomonas_euryale.AAC.12
MFKAIDLDGTGLISVEELQEALRKRGASITATEVETVSGMRRGGGQGGKVTCEVRGKGNGIWEEGHWGGVHMTACGRREEREGHV